MHTYIYIYIYIYRVGRFFQFGSLCGSLIILGFCGFTWDYVGLGGIGGWIDRIWGIGGIRDIGAIRGTVL